MERERFWYDGIRSDTVGLRLQGPVTFGSTSARIETVSVPGRNGDLHIWDGSYANVDGEANCFALQKEHVEMAINAVSRWLLLSPKYRKLITTEEPDIYRMALVTAGPETEIRMRTLAPFSISFNCMPQKFYCSGEREVAIDKSGFVIYNTGFPSLPAITIKSNGNGNLYINDTNVLSVVNYSGEIKYDADTQNAYNGNQNLNDKISAPEKISLPNGECKISWGGDIESVSIIPRWWTL